MGVAACCTETFWTNTFWTNTFWTDTLWKERRDDVTAAAPGVGLIRLAGDAPVPPDDLERITIAYFSAACWPDRVAAFTGACLRSPNLRWPAACAAAA